MKKLLSLLLALYLSAVGAPPLLELPTGEATLPPSYTLQFRSTQSGIYNYCPSIMQLDDQTRYIYYCTNEESYNVTDFIGCRKGTKNADGTWTWGEETIVLWPSDDGWDARHTCDPSVIAGDFTYQGKQYTYLMAYLGCTSDNSQDNKIGLAVANYPEGPFYKVGDAPLIDFVRDESLDVFQWGVGQPSLINLDRKSNVVLFYSRGDKDGTRTIAEEWDFSDLSSPKRKSSVKLSETGLQNLDGHPDILNNADFVYDSARDRFYASSDCHPNPSGMPDYISSHFRVTYFDRRKHYDTITWQNLSQIGEAETSFARNHNTGILRDAYGHLPGEFLTVYYTVSRTGDSSLWSYRIYDYHVASAE